MGAGGWIADLKGLKELVSRFSDPVLIQELNKIPQQKGVAALVAQAIADNFAKEGPGWKALKPATIRASLSKSMRKKIRKLSSSEVRDFETLSRKKSLSNREVNELARLNVKMKNKKPMQMPNRLILQKTGLLKKTVTTPGFQGSSGNVSGSNVYKVEGTNLIWGTDLVYAATHQYGNSKKGVPARPYLTIRDEWQKQLNDFITEKALTLIKKYIAGGK